MNTFNNKQGQNLQEIEKKINKLNARVEQLKIQFNLFFTGELNLPPEKEREQIEKSVRRLLTSEFKAPRINLLAQNIASSFSLYNNMWLKKMNELETGVVTIKRKKIKMNDEPLPKTKKAGRKEELVSVSLNDETTFDNFYNKCTALMNKSNLSESKKEEIINSLKVKLISKTIVDATVSLTVNKGKLSIKLKK